MKRNLGCSRFRMLLKTGLVNCSAFVENFIMTWYSKTLPSYAVLFCLILLIFGCGNERKLGETEYKIRDTLFLETFDQVDTTSWIVESEEEFDLPSRVSDSALDIYAAKGITIWNTNRFSGNLMFEFEVTVVKEGGKNDRVSDLNCFWMAKDPAFPDNFFVRSLWRNGIFQNYYSLDLYYVGYGGHDNTKTRFRKYNGVADPVPPVLQEYSDPVHLIVANREYVIKIICYDSLIQYHVNGEKLFELKDDQPYREGYFGFRTTNNHMKVDSFKVYSLE